jgi:hypothetical protein
VQRNNICSKIDNTDWEIYEESDNDQEFETLASPSWKNGSELIAFACKPLGIGSASAPNLISSTPKTPLAAQNYG